MQCWAHWITTARPGKKVKEKVPAEDENRCGWIYGIKVFHGHLRFRHRREEIKTYTTQSE
jgi:hypothetical protein